MALILALLSIGSIILAVAMTYQVKYINPTLIETSKYNLYILPLIFLANSALGLGFIKGYERLNNMPLLIGIQAFIYYIAIIALAKFMLGDKISVKTFIAFGFIILGIYLLKK